MKRSSCNFVTPNTKKKQMNPVLERKQPKYSYGKTQEYAWWEKQDKKHLAMNHPFCHMELTSHENSE